MSTIERAYDLIDQYAEKTQGYVVVTISRWNFFDGKMIEVDYILTAQALSQSESYNNVASLIQRLERLLA